MIDVRRSDDTELFGAWLALIEKHSVSPRTAETGGWPRRRGHPVGPADRHPQPEVRGPQRRNPLRCRSGDPGRTCRPLRRLQHRRSRRIRLSAPTDFCRRPHNDPAGLPRCTRGVPHTARPPALRDAGAQQYPRRTLATARTDLTNPKTYPISPG